MSKIRVPRKPARSTAATRRTETRTTVSAIMVLREAVYLVTIRERLCGIAEGLRRTQRAATATSLQSACDADRREEYLRRVLHDAIALEAIAISAVAGRLDALCDPPAEVA